MNDPDSEGTREASSSSAVAQQSIPEPPGLDLVESHRPNALVSLLSRSSRASGEVYEALTDLRELVSERVLRDVRALEKSVDSKIESLKLTVNTRIDTLEKTINERFESVSARFGGVNTKIDALEKTVNERFGSVNERFKGVNERFKGVNERFEALEKTLTARFDGVYTRIDALEKTVDARFGGVDAQFDGLNARLDSLEKSIEALRWMVGLLIALVIALIALVVGSLFFFRFSPPTYPDYPARVPGAYYGDPPQAPAAPEKTASEPELADPEDAAAETPDSERRLSP